MGQGPVALHRMMLRAVHKLLGCCKISDLLRIKRTDYRHELVLGCDLVS